MFLLTAGHVIDCKKDGNLCIPSDKGIKEISGKVYSIPMLGTKSTEDTIDLAYIELSTPLDSNIIPLTRNDLRPNEMNLENDFYTFAGFPHKKSKVENRQLSTHLCTFSSSQVSTGEMDQSGFHPAQNISISYNRKHSIHFQTERKQQAPFLEGVSGGGIFFWPKDHLVNLENGVLPIGMKCVGIVHTYSQTRKLLTGTKISMFVAAISKSHPHLQQELNPAAQSDKDMALVWYYKRNWSRFLDLISSEDNMPQTWERWREGAEEMIEQMSIRGISCFPVPLGLGEILRECKRHNLTNDGYGRGIIASKKLHAFLTGKTIRSIQTPSDFPRSPR